MPTLSSACQVSVAGFWAAAAGAGSMCPDVFKNTESSALYVTLVYIYPRACMTETVRKKDSVYRVAINML
jgi:hypothetical protein